MPQEHQFILQHCSAGARILPSHMNEITSMLSFHKLNIFGSSGVIATLNRRSKLKILSYKIQNKFYHQTILSAAETLTEEMANIIALRQNDQSNAKENLHELEGFLSRLSSCQLRTKILQPF